jgi:uncharacterized protein YndB with AHSA1/START domain
MSEETKDFVTSRDFDVPRPTLWSCFTEPERMRQWWGPKGAKVVAANMDLRSGGSYHYGLQMPDGKTLWGKFVYREVVAPERLVFINFFSDEKGGVTRHPMAPTWPLELLSTFTFDDLGPKRSRFTVRWTPHKATEEEREVFNSDAMRVSMTQGWGGTMDQLESYLASLKA